MKVSIAFVFSLVFFFTEVGGTQKAATNPSACVQIPAPSFENLTPCEVVRILDGNRIEVNRDNTSVVIHLIGVDPSPKNSSSKPANADGDGAISFLTNLLKGEKVYLLYNGEKPRPDQEGGIPVYVYRYPDGLFVNAELIRQGYSRADLAESYSHRDEFRLLEQFARQKEKGIWSLNSAEAAPPVSASSSASANEQGKENSDLVYINPKGKKYHSANCTYVKENSAPISREEAVKKGYTPCSRCKP